MKNKLSILFLIVFCLSVRVQGQEVVKQQIDVVSGNLKLSLMVGSDNRLYQLHFGDVSKAEIGRAHV